MLPTKEDPMDSSSIKTTKVEDALKQEIAESKQQLAASNAQQEALRRENEQLQQQVAQYDGVETLRIVMEDWRAPLVALNLQKENERLKKRIEEAKALLHKIWALFQSFPAELGEMILEAPAAAAGAAADEQAQPPQGLDEVNEHEQQEEGTRQEPMDVEDKV